MKRQLGFLRRKFQLATLKAWEHIYRCSILSKLEYCSSLWDPHQINLIDKLEHTQKFAARVITGKWKSDYPSLCCSLKWKTLELHRKLQKVKVCYNIVHQYSSISPTTFTFHPHPSPWCLQNKILFKPFVSTSAHRFSFFISIIPLWNIYTSSAYHLYLYTL